MPCPGPFGNSTWPVVGVQDTAEARRRTVTYEGGQELVPLLICSSSTRHVAP